MKKLKIFIVIPILLGAFVTVLAQGKKSDQRTNNFTALNNVTWNSLGKDENDSMPLGNGDFSANVWTEQNGDLLLLLSKADAWTETGKIVKLGRVRLKFSTNPFSATTGFSQTLNLEKGAIEIKSGSNSLLVWIDANRPVLHVETHLEHAATLQAGAEIWRKTVAFKEYKETDNAGIMTGESSPKTLPDILSPASGTQIGWFHFNATSYYPYLLKQEHLESLISKTTDPLLHRSFGIMMSGPGLKSIDERILKSASPGTDLRLDVFAISGKITSAKNWDEIASARNASVSAKILEQSWVAHQQWWANFWNRSWIHLEGKDDAAKVSQGYIIQRYMVAASSRGELPPKFNGGAFTVGHDVDDTVKQNKIKHDADWRAWGDSYWNQNERLLYWPLIATGDTDLIKPWLNMYLKALPLAIAKNRIYYNHDGASFPETMHFWGLSNLNDFGKNNPTNEIQSHWQKYHVQGSLEIIAQMLDIYDQQQDINFAKESIVPFAEAIVTYYDQHWPRDANGKIYMSPAQSLESYQLVAVNPTPDIAGLMSILPRLIALPPGLVTTKQREAWTKTLHDLPAIPLGTTARGKLPPLGVGDPDGLQTILPAEKYGKAGNSENPELYTAFPYRIYGVGKPGLELAQNTFAARRSPQNTCWGQDGTQAAVLGMTAVAQKAAIAEFTNYGDQRFPWFWKPAHDWIPDLDNGGDGMITLQNMLMQYDGRSIQLLPAWPREWTADFKLHAPYNTTIEGHVQNGKITNLRVIPESRAKDVKVLNAK